MKKKFFIQIPAVTIIRLVLNTGFRMIFPFQPIFMQQLGIELGRMTRMLAGQSFVGVVSPLLASMADRRGRKFGMLAGLALFSLGGLVVILQPTVFSFLLFLILSLLGKSIFDPSMQAYFGDHVPYERRGTVLALTEMSWSGAFFLGVPLVGFLLDRAGLLAPFILLSVLGVLSLITVVWLIPPDPEPDSGRPTILANFGTVFSSPSAWAGLSLMILICLANQLVNVSFGVWLNESFSLQAAALGIASAVIGAAEFVGEGGVSIISDRLSKKRAVRVGILSSVLSAAVLPWLGQSQLGALIGLFLFYLSFEFTIVSAIPLMTGVVPAARATLMALNIASANLGRGVGSWVAAPVFELGFRYTAWLAAMVNLGALIALHFVTVKE